MDAPSRMHFMAFFPRQAVFQGRCKTNPALEKENDEGVEAGIYDCVYVAGSQAGKVWADSRFGSQKYLGLIGQTPHSGISIHSGGDGETS